MKKCLLHWKTQAGILFVLAAVFFALSSPLRVHAAGGLEMSTPYPGITVQAGEDVNFDLELASTAGGLDAALSIVSLPDGWSGYFMGSDSQISRVHVPGSGSDPATATFSLDIPEDAAEGSYLVQLQADAGGGASDILELAIDVSAESAGQGSFTSEYPEQQGSTGTSFTFDTTLVNNRGTEQSYSLSAEAPSGWQVSFTPASESSQVASITVDAGSAEGLTVNITPPENIEQGTYTIPCTAISANETLRTELVIEITGTYQVVLTTPTGNLSLDAYANAEDSFTLLVQNTGNVDLHNLNLTSSLPTGWEVRFEESTIDTLEAGGSTEITAYLTPSSDAITGDYVATLTAGNDETSADAQFRVSVKTRTTWGIAAAVIILLLIAGLWYLFKKYGRR